MIDNLGGRLGSFDRVERALLDGEQWSAYDKGIGAGAYFAARTAPEVDTRAPGRLSARFAPNLRKLRAVFVTSSERRSAPNYPWVPWQRTLRNSSGSCR